VVYGYGMTMSDDLTVDMCIVKMEGLSVNDDTVMLRCEKESLCCWFAVMCVD